MSPALSKAASSTTKSFPTRMAFFYVPNGVHMDDWTPTTEGTDFWLPYILEPLKAFKDDMLVLSGLAQDNAFAKGDGPGDHARSLACFLTGVHPRKTDGSNIKVGVSVDQVAAQRVGNRTRFPSLELGCDRGAQSGNCDSGYSCAYSSNISWRSESVPTGKEVNPRLVFERLFSNHLAGEVASNRSKRERYNRSILDFVSEDARSLQARLGANDQRKVDEYLTSLREIEIRLTHTETDTSADAVPGFAKPVGIPKDYKEHIRLMCDLLVLAFQGDLTRVSTFMFANEGSNKSYPFIGVPEGHHDISHHGNDIQKLIKISQINNFHMTQFAYLLEKMKSIPEGDGTLLDNMMIVYGSGIGDGNRHNHDNLPVLLVGRGGGTISTGRHVRHPRRTPLNNLFLSILDRMDASTDVLGDSNGKLTTLTV
jgi:Protein of unknown function (DUF1552)